MKFKVISNALVAACEDSAQFIALVVDECELFGLDDLRTMEQNKKMWPMLKDISDQVVWMGQKHDTLTWKYIIIAAHTSQVFVHGLGGSLVVIPSSTRRLSKKRFSELIEQIYSFGDEQEVKWSEPALRAYSEYREAA